MIHHVFTVHDAKSEAYLPPFHLQTKGQAIRAFTDCVNDPNHQFAKHPEDYTLFELGEFDDHNGQYACHTTPKPIGKAIEFKETN